MLSLSQFRVLQLVATHGSLATAAVKLNRSSSAVSLALKQLEADLGGQLFEGDRKSKLTPLGRYVVEETRPLLEHYQRVVEAIQHHAHGATGRLDIACVPSVAATIMPDAITEIWRTRPGVQVEIRDMDSRSVTQAVVLGTVEIGLASHTDRHDELVETALFSDPLDVVCSTDSALGTDDRPIEWAEVRKWPFLANGSYAVTPSTQLEAIDTNRAMYIANVISLQAAVRANMGITLLPRLMRPSAMPGVKFLPLADRTARREVHVIYRKGHHLSALSIRLLNTLIDVLKTNQEKLDINLYHHQFNKPSPQDGHLHIP